MQACTVYSLPGIHLFIEMLLSDKISDHFFSLNNLSKLITGQIFCMPHTCTKNRFEVHYSDFFQLQQITNLTNILKDLLLLSMVLTSVPGIH